MALSESVFVDKMEKLNSTQESIENTSTWCSLWRSDARRIVAWWENAFAKANMNKRMCMIYLASDVMLNSRKKGPEFVHEFYKVLPRALRHFLSKADNKSSERVQKVIRVWEQRKVFGSSGSKSMQELIDEAEAPKKGGTGAAGAPTSLAAAASAVAAAEAAAARAMEAGAAVTDARAAPDHAEALREALARHGAALREEAGAREAARAALQAAADAHATGAAMAAQAAAAAEADLAATPAALSPVAPAGPGGVEATVDAAEAAALAAQLMQNPQALLEAIAATMQPGGGGNGGGEGLGAAAAPPAPAEEYDPAEAW